MLTPLLVIAALHCEYLINPVGIEAARPRLGWVMQAEGRDRRQSAYHVLVASTPELLGQDVGDLWDTGKVRSDQSVQVVYAGAALAARQRAYWKVRVWDETGRPMPWSAPGWWEMGLLAEADWGGAHWLATPRAPEGAPVPLEELPHYTDGATPESVARFTTAAPEHGAPQFRREFNLPEVAIRRARLYVCGLGYHEVYVNGQKLGDHVLDPAQTDYEQRALYVVHDAQPLLTPGANVLGVVLGNGFYNQRAVWGDLGYGRPRFLLRLVVEHFDGSETSITSDDRWRAKRGPILMNNVYAGEHYDARLETPGWTVTGFDNAGWARAAAVEAPGGRLEAQLLPPIRRIAERSPSAVTEPQPGVYVFDLGQNLSGWARVEARGPEGHVVRMRYAEALGADGMIDTASTGVFATHVEQVDTYVCKGTDVPEPWEPRFTYHGFRYVEVTGLIARPGPETLRGVVVHSDLPGAGSFSSSDAMLNRLQQTARWTLLSGMHGLPTDCPTREKCGWLGDAHVIAEMGIFNFYMPQFWTKYLGDIETTRRGNVPSMIAPGKRLCGVATPDWATAYIQIPWRLYQYYGDERVLAEHYAGMTQLFDVHDRQRKDGILSAGLGDWCPPGSVEPVSTPVALTSTAYFYQDALILAKVANVLGKIEDAARFEDIARGTRAAFIAKFYDAAAKSFGSQTADAFALYLGLCPDGEAQAVADSLARDVTEKHGGHHSTGITGSRYLYWALSEYGHGAVALGMLHQEDYPSFGHLFSRGATTFWESWGEPEVDAKWGARSQNHPMQGGFAAWFFHGLGGIQPVDAAPGFKEIYLAPQIVPGLADVAVEYVSLYGPIRSSWRVEAGVLTWDVLIPANTRARLRVPAAAGAEVLEGGVPVAEAVGVHWLGTAPGGVLLAAGSGAYRFTVGNPGATAGNVVE